MRGRNPMMQSMGVLAAVMVFMAAGSVVYAAKAKKEKSDKPGGGKVKAIEKASFGTVDGKPVDIYTLTNAKGAVAKITNYGAIVTELQMPDRNGKMGDVVLGLDTVDDYVKSSPYFGATIGRIANRISGAQFQLEGATYRLAANNGSNSSVKDMVPK